jgi:hypothetical protein
MATSNSIPKKYKSIKPSDFALAPGEYPIDTIGRARSALARVAANGTPAEQQKVRDAVAAKYPSINVTGASKKYSRAGAAALKKTSS